MFGFQTDAAVAAFGAAGTSVWRKAVLQCGEKRHFGATSCWVPRCGGTAVPVKAGGWSVLAPFPFDFSSRLRGFLDDLAKASSGL